MSANNKVGIFLLSSFLIFATALAVPAQSTAPAQDQTIRAQDHTTQSQATPTRKGAASKDDIRNAQQALKDKGMYTGAVDGTLNADTQKGLRDFQQKNNLKATGTLNHETRAALGITSQQPGTGRTPTSKSETSGTTSSKGGTAGATSTPRREKGTNEQTSSTSRHDVRDTQAALKNEGFDPGPIDGILGAKTMTALRNYQSHNHLDVTGTITAQTQNAVMGTASASGSRNKPEAEGEFQPQAQPYSSTQPYSSEYSSTRESLSSQSGIATSPEDVRQVQQALANLMYNPGDINGMMTAQTQQALREFQYLNNLPVTGRIDDQTKIAIDSQSAGGFQSAQFGETYSSNVTREKSGITTEQQTQTRTDSSSTTTSHDTTVDRDSSKSGGKYDKNHRTSGKVDKDLTERATKAADVLRDLTGTSDKRIPNELLERAEAIAVVPNVVKGAFGVGGRFGKGLVSDRMENGHWSAPAFMSIGGGSFGAQIGVSSTDLVLVFTDRNALKMLESGKDLKLGADASVAAGPIGRSAEAGVNAKLDTGIFAYSRAKGLFAGVALDGAVLSIDKDANEKVYGASADATDILNGKFATNPTVQPFMSALDKNVPAKRISQK